MLEDILEYLLLEINDSRYGLQSGGPGWEVETGRRDSLVASKEDANNDIPGPSSTMETLLAKFQNVGLTLEDMVALSGIASL